MAENFIDERVVSYKQGIKELTDLWKVKDLHKNGIFIEDGIVCPEVYFKRKERILFFLKEAYTSGDKFSLVEYLDNQDNRTPKLWQRVSKWTKWIINYMDKGQFTVFSKKNDYTNNGNEYLKSIAIINVKKSNGKPNSHDEDLRKYVEADKQEIYEELKLCDPTIVICGYTGDYLKSVIEGNGEQLTQLTQMDKEHFIYRFMLNGHGVVAVNYWHPANQYPDLMNYYGLTGILQVALQKG